MPAKEKYNAGPKPIETLIVPSNAKIQDVAKYLRKLVFEEVLDASEGIYGGSKVGIALYSLGSPTNVLCGIQPVGENCLFYAHRVKPGDSGELKLEGQGKHALHVKFRSADEIKPDALRALLRIALGRMPGSKS